MGLVHPVIILPGSLLREGNDELLTSAENWEEPGKLAKDGIVFYHVLVADEATGGVTHVWVNAIDGKIIGTDKELPRKQRNP